MPSCEAPLTPEDVAEATDVAADAASEEKVVVVVAELASLGTACCEPPNKKVGTCDEVDMVSETTLNFGVLGTTPSSTSSN